jgi:hypothetical protein
MADIIINPGSSIMSFTSSLNYTQTLTQDAPGSLILAGSGSTGRTDLFTVNGNNGTLFSVSDDLSDSLFSVNTIAGLPVIEAFANNTVVMGQYGQNVLVVTGSNVGLGTSTPSARLHVSGSDAILRNAYIGEVSGYGATNAQFSHISRAGAGEYSFLSAADGETYINSKTGYNINFRVNNSNVAIITSGGNVGIGTTSISNAISGTERVLKISNPNIASMLNPVLVKSTSLPFWIDNFFVELLYASC